MMFVPSFGASVEQVARYEMFADSVLAAVVAAEVKGSQCTAAVAGELAGDSGAGLVQSIQYIVVAKDSDRKLWVAA